MELLTLPIALALFLAGGLAGFIDSMAGGGGLITLPALLAAGLSPAQALGTNKLQSSFGSFSATWNFVRRGRVDLREMAGCVACTFVGAALGAALVQFLRADFLAGLLPFLLVGIAAYFLFSPRVGEVDSHRRVGLPAFAATAGFGLGFYDGFFGPGTGSFLALAFVGLLGFNLAKATAHAKLLNFTSNFAALLAFLVGGEVVWAAGLVMAAGQFLGAHLGSNLVMSRGARLVRPVLVAVSLAITARLLWADEAGLVRAGWSRVAGFLGGG